MTGIELASRIDDPDYGNSTYFAQGRFL